MEFIKDHDLLQINDLTDLINEEWSKVKKIRTKRISFKNNLNKKIYEEYEALEELVIGLFGLLNEKVTHFIIKKNLKAY